MLQFSVTSLWRLRICVLQFLNFRSALLLLSLPCRWLSEIGTVSGKTHELAGVFLLGTGTFVS